MKQLSNYAYGTVLMILGVLVLSPDSGLLRLIDGDPYVVSFWRGIGICLVLWAAALTRSPAEFVYQLTHHTAVSIGIVLSFGMSSMSFVFGVTLLGAPTMLVFVALTPLASAFASRILFGESTDLALWIAIVIGIIGASISGSAIPDGTPLAGYLACLFVPGLTGLGLSLTRHYPREHIWPLYGSANLMMACVIWFVIDTVSVPQESVWLLTINACIVCSLSFMLITIAPKYLPAPEVGLYLLLETLIGPVIVWILVGEVPRRNDFIGGAVLLAALIGLFSYRMRQLSKQELV
jgi:drug/metabolite transporter (DMT)-like permease